MSHRILGKLDLFIFVRRLFRVAPGVLVKHLLLFLFELLEGFFIHDGNAEFDGIEHHVIVVIKQGRVVRQGNQAADRHLMIPDLQGVPDREGIVVRVHTVNRDLLSARRQFAVHETGQVDRFSHLEDTQCRAPRASFLICLRFCVLFEIKLLLHRHTGILPDAVQSSGSRFVRCDEVTPFHLILLEALVICRDHASGCHKKTGHKSDHQDHKQKNHDIFSEFPLQLPRKSFYQWVSPFHFSTPRSTVYYASHAGEPEAACCIPLLPVQIRRPDLHFVPLILPDFSVT